MNIKQLYLKFRLGSMEPQLHHFVLKTYGNPEFIADVDGLVHNYMNQNVHDEPVVVVIQPVIDNVGLIKGRNLFRLGSSCRWKLITQVIPWFISSLRKW